MTRCIACGNKTTSGIAVSPIESEGGIMCHKCLIKTGTIQKLKPIEEDNPIKDLVEENNQLRSLIKKGQQLILETSVENIELEKWIIESDKLIKDRG